ncbi:MULTISPECIES: hypothetical protein [unclassified Streptomyces]|uniref:hypothetical protein n=1 Tax=unclassified Streptomyces TaxID=2593676 RepID=UPI002E2A788B|nr:hypothetical protein [Streptomyces sp. NBC_00223]
MTTLFDPADGSYARIADNRPGSGAEGATVVAAGPRDLWEPIETARSQWLSLNKPRREWFTISVTPERQTVGYVTPDGRVLRWDLLPVATSAAPG